MRRLMVGGQMHLRPVAVHGRGESCSQRRMWTQECDVDDSFHDTGGARRQSTKEFLWLHEVRWYIGLAHALHVCHVG
jgi:hypothetical protein